MTTSKKREDDLKNKIKKKWKTTKKKKKKEEKKKEKKDNLKKWNTNQSTKNNLIGCDTIVNSPSLSVVAANNLAEPLL